MSQTALKTDEALTIARLRQWAALRTGLRAGRTASYRSAGYARRSSSMNDAAQVRVIDFERALDMLPDDAKIALILRYRDREPDAEICRAIRCSARKVGYLIPDARRKLATILDQLHLL